MLDTSAGSKDTILLATFRPGVALLRAALKPANHLHHVTSYAGHIFYIYIETYLARIRMIGTRLTVAVLHINCKSMPAIKLQKVPDFGQNEFFVSRQCLAGYMIELGFDN